MSDAAVIYLGTWAQAKAFAAEYEIPAYRMRHACAPQSLAGITDAVIVTHTAPVAEIPRESWDLIDDLITAGAAAYWDGVTPLA